MVNGLRSTPAQPVLLQHSGTTLHLNAWDQNVISVARRIRHHRAVNDTVEPRPQTAVMHIAQGSQVCTACNHPVMKTAVWRRPAECYRHCAEVPHAGIVHEYGGLEGRSLKAMKTIQMDASPEPTGAWLT
jgi:hypothetical protein